MIDRESSDGCTAARVVDPGKYRPTGPLPGKSASRHVVLHVGTSRIEAWNAVCGTDHAPDWGHVRGSAIIRPGGSPERRAFTGTNRR